MNHDQGNTHENSTDNNTNKELHGSSVYSSTPGHFNLKKRSVRNLDPKETISSPLLVDHMDIPDEWMSEIYNRVARKYESYHSMIFWFYILCMLIGCGMLACVILFPGADKRFEVHRYFLAFIVTPIYVLCASMIIFTRKHYMLNNAATHAFSFVFGYLISFISFIMFNRFIIAISVDTTE